MTGKPFLKILFMVLIGLFALAMTNLFVLRFKAGDIYPHYSSFRSDPLGTKALYESLLALNSHEMERSYSPIKKLNPNADYCLFYLGVPSRYRFHLTETEMNALIRFAENGSRIIIAFKPGAKMDQDNDPCEKQNETLLGNKTEKQVEGGDDEDAWLNEKQVDLLDAWGISFQFKSSSDKEVRFYPASFPTGTGSEPPLILPFSFGFKSQNNDWKTIVTVNELPVIIEKQFKNGSVILSADSYIFSNESLKKNKTGHLISMMIAEKSMILFDEFHLGVQKQPGVSSLLKKYNLYSPMVLILIFILLFIWHRTYSLIPPDEKYETSLLDKEKPDWSISKDNHSGLVNLFRQHIESNDLITECKTAWKNSFVKNNRVSKKYQKLWNRIESEKLKRKKKMKPAEEYNSIATILSEREKYERLH